MENGVGSAESIFGWSQSYLSLGNWPDRIREAHRGPHRDRDELDFYMCFFVQAYSLRDWMIKHKVMQQPEIDLAINSHYEMQLCRDICHRYKHLVISKPSVDDKWSIRRHHIVGTVNEWSWAVIGADRMTDLWDLMVACLSFWEALVAAYGLDAKEDWFLR